MIKLPSKKECGGLRFGQMLSNASVKSCLMPDDEYFTRCLGKLFYISNGKLELIINSYLKEYKKLTNK